MGCCWMRKLSVGGEMGWVEAGKKSVWVRFERLELVGLGLGFGIGIGIELLVGLLLCCKRNGQSLVGNLVDGLMNG